MKLTNAFLVTLAALALPAMGSAQEKDAQKYWFEQRAYPNHSIDQAAHVRAAKHRDLEMLPAKLITPKIVNGVLQPSTTNVWQFLGPTNIGAGETQTTPWSGRVNGIAYVPGNTSAFYVATSSGGVWKTTDAGANWTPLSDNWPFLYSSCVAVHPTNTNIIYAGTGDFASDYSGNGVTLGSGLMKSADAGATWTALGIAQGFDQYSISDILIDPENPNIVTISEGRGRTDTGQTGTGFIWRTTDGGGTWTKVVNVNKSWSKLAMSAISGGVRFYYAISQDGVLYRSADRGATWAALTSPVASGNISIDRIATHPTAQQTAYLLDSKNGKVFKTINAGSTWTDVTNNLVSTNDFSQASYDTFIGVTSVAGIDNIYVGGIDLSLSTNGGSTWARVGQVHGVNPKLHADQQCIVFDPTDPTSGLIGCAGGIYHFNYNTGTAVFTGTSLSGKLGNTELYHLDIHPANVNIVLSGAKDNGSQYSRSGNLSFWELEIPGDDGYCGIDAANTLIQYAGSPFGKLTRTNDEWVSNVTQIEAAIPTGTAFAAPFELDPNNGDVLYIGAGFGVNRYTSSTNTWSNHLGGVNLSTAYLQAVTVAPSNSSRIYTGAVDGQVWMTSNGGTTWTQINGGTPALPNRAVTSVAVDPANPDDVLVGLSGTGTGHLFRCTNPGAGASRVWTDVSGVATTLPDIPLNCIARDPQVAGSWYVGTDAGVFMSTDSGANWQNASNPLGLPNVRTNFLKIRSSDRNMYAATWGRGVWRIQLPFPSIVAGVAANPNPITGGSSGTGTVTLWQVAPAGGTTVNLSSNNPAAVIPATVTVLQGATTATFPITATNSTYATIGATITESLASDPNHSAVLSVLPNNRASFVSQSVPSSMIAGQSYPVTLQYTNTGQTTWDIAHLYKLQSRNATNNTTWGSNRITLTNAPVAPGGTGTFTSTVIAPATTGSYNFQWIPIEDAVPVAFGAPSPNFVVAVTKVADAARFISKTGATTVFAGSDFFSTNTMMNVGTTTWKTSTFYSMMSINPNNNVTWGTNRIAIPTGVTQVLPNAQVTFSRLCTAPITPGTYTMQWQMDRGGVAFGDTTPLINMIVVSGPDNAQYVSTSAFPHSMAPSGTFSATFTMKNLGSTTWSAANYSLVSIGNNNFGVPSIAAGSVVQNANGTFVGNFTAPAAPGTYTLQFRMQHTATKFGQSVPSATIVVGPDAAQYISRSGATTVAAGADFYSTYTMKNTGSTTWTSAAGYRLNIIPATDTTWTANRINIVGSIAPGSNLSNSALCTAPIVPGTYTMQWQMSKGGVLFGDTTPIQNIIVTSSADDAQFISQTGVPTTIAHGATFTPTITMKNLGTATWDGTYSLSSIGSSFGLASIAATSTAPNASKAFSGTFTAPATPGTYRLQLRMKHNTTLFGQPTTSVTITVT